MSYKRKCCRGLAGMIWAMMIGLSADVVPVQAQESPTVPVQTQGSPTVPSAIPFIADAKAGYLFRLSYFGRASGGDNGGGDLNPGTNFRQQAAGIGGWLYGNTGEIGKVLSFGGTFNFTLPLYGPYLDPFNYILKDLNQEGYGVLGEAYGKLRFGNHDVVLGRQSMNYAWYLEDVYRFYNKLDQSMIGRRDVRAMQPLTYTAATVQGKFRDDTVRYYAGYVWDMKQINDDTFRNLFQAAYQTTVFPESNKTGESNGMIYAGIGFKPTRDMMVLGSYYAVNDMLNMAYADFDYVFRLGDQKYLRFGAQYLFQESNGQSLITGGRPFTTGYGGLYLEVRLIPWLVNYGMAGLTGDGDEIRSPFSIGPSYLVQRIGENSKAGEHTWILGTIIDFKTLGVNGLSFDINYGQRSNRHVAGENGQPLADWDELATDLVYVFAKDGFFKNMRTRLRYAKAWERGNQFSAGTVTNFDREQNDFRCDVQLNIPFK